MRSFYFGRAVRPRLGVYGRSVVVLSVAWVVGAACYSGYEDSRWVSAAAHAAASDCQAEREYAQNLIVDRDRGNRVAALLSASMRPEKELRRDCEGEAEAVFRAKLPTAVSHTATWALLPVPIFWIAAALGAWAYSWVLAGRSTARRARDAG
jgi:hypothetical protein